MSTSRSDRKAVKVDSFAEFQKYLLDPTFTVTSYDFGNYEEKALVEHFGYREAESISEAVYDCDPRYHDDDEAIDDLSNYTDILICAENESKIIVLEIDEDDFRQFALTELLPFILQNKHPKMIERSAEDEFFAFMSEYEKQMDKDVKELPKEDQVDDLGIKPFGFSSFDDYLKK